MADKEKVDEAPKPDYSKDENVQARLRAGRRSSKRNAGEPIEEPKVEKPKVEEPTPEVEGFEDGGIVGAAEKESEAVSEEPSEEAPSEEAPAAEAGGEEPPMAEPPVGEYQAPEGESHEDLIDQYHEALAFGDMDQAKQLYKQLQEHRFHENTHRAKSQAQAEKEESDYLAAAQELANAHPELAQDGLEADKVLALSDVYRNNGMSAVEALRKAVADLYQGAAPEPATPETPVEETSAPVEETPAPVEEPPAPEPELPDMEDRKEKKKSIPAMPSASARNEPPPPPKQPTRSDAIAQMKAKRGQA